ncbi:UNVERIFIED_CONTAM: movement protein [Sesamum radiatum]|uniref:Movement protein n=1 Tax=Sesamum radiatum TaxID=300843 RepID=A0AAW2Q0V6_SESRA
MKVSKTATAGLAEQKVTYLPIARINVVNYANSKPQMTSLMQSITEIWYQFTNSRTFLQMKGSMRKKWRLIQMDLQPSQSNYNKGDRLQTSGSLSGFFSRMTVSNKTTERIMRQGSNLSPYDGFRIGGIGRVLNEIGINQRRHHIIYKVSSGEFAIPMELTGNVMKMQLIPKEEILEELRKLMFDINSRIAYNLADQDFSRVLTLHQNFKRKDLMKEGNRPYYITYRIWYALSNTHHSDLFLRKEYIEISRIFKQYAKVITPDPIRIPKIGGVDIVIKDHQVLERTLSTRIEFSSKMSFSEDRITGYRGKEKELIKTFTPQQIRQPINGRYEGMLEIAGHKILVAGADILLGNNFIQTFAKYIQDNNKNLLSFPTNYGSEIQVFRRGKAFNRIMSINFRSKHSDFDARVPHPKMQDNKKFGKALLSFRQQGLIDINSFYEE